jgi:tetratricopeptide (TPR) repeat protein
LSDIIAGMRVHLLVPALMAAAALGACAAQGPAETRPAPVPAGAPPAGSAQPVPAIPGQPPGAAERPAAPPPRQFHLGPAASALVAQAHQQAMGGDYGQAAATLERALRIEPDNPLVWIELGRIRLAESNPAQADAMGRKALALATGDPAAQSSAWRLIADSLRARGNNGEAAEADRHAQSLTPQ